MIKTAITCNGSVEFRLSSSNEEEKMCGSRRRRLEGSKLTRDERGLIAMACVILLPVLLGFAALGLDVGYLLDKKQRTTAAADACAVAGAVVRQVCASMS